MHKAEIARLLPEVFQRTIWEGGPLDLLLEVMEQLHAPSEEVLETLDKFFNPYRAPDEFVPFLAFWVDLDELLLQTRRTLDGEIVSPLSTGMGRLRELIACAAYLSQWRGTKKGLIRFLETATGEKGFEVDERVRDASNRVIPYHLRITAPRSTEPFRPLLVKIIELEKPAYVTYELVFA